MKSKPYTLECIKRRSEARLWLSESILTQLIDNHMVDEAVRDNGIVVPIRRSICIRCNGRGQHVHPDIDGHGISHFENPEFEADYYDGHFDIDCIECKGEKVITVPILNDEIEKAIDSWWENEAMMRAEDDAERAAGCY